MCFALQEHYYRLDPILKKALQNFVREHMAEHVQDEENHEKEFWVSFYNMPIIERMRDLKAGKLGRLVSFAGTVTRTSEVRAPVTKSCIPWSGTDSHHPLPLSPYPVI